MGGARVQERLATKGSKGTEEREGRRRDLRRRSVLVSDVQEAEFAGGLFKVVDGAGVGRFGLAVVIGQ